MPQPAFERGPPRARLRGLQVDVPSWLAWLDAADVNKPVDEIAVAARCAVALWACGAHKLRGTDPGASRCLGSAKHHGGGDRCARCRVVDGYYTIDELSRSGSWSSRDDARAMVCRRMPSSACASSRSRAPSRASCPSFEEKREDLSSRASGANGDRTVHCQRAEVGHCGKLRYFYFKGDTDRDEMRWFDETGALLARRNATDYPAYCEGWSESHWEGKVPKCTALGSRRALVRRSAAPLTSAIEDMRTQTGPPNRGVLRRASPLRLLRASQGWTRG